MTIGLNGAGAGQCGQIESWPAASRWANPLNVQLAAGFAPAVGSQFQILAGASLSGVFTATNIPSGISLVYSNNGVYLNVDSPVSAISITGQPVGQTVVAGATAGFSVTATGAGPLNYQWQADGGESFRIMPADQRDSQSNRLTITGVQTGDAANYQVIVANAAATVVSSSDNLVVFKLRRPCPPGFGFVAMAGRRGCSVDAVGGNEGVLTNGVTYAPGEVGQAI